jgi:hypothetical protein
MVYDGLTTTTNGNNFENQAPAVATITMRSGCPWFMTA